MTSPIFDDESFYSDDGFDFLGEIEEVGNRPWEIAPLDKKFRVIFLLVMIIIGPDIKNINVRLKVSHSQNYIFNLRKRSPAEFYNSSNIATR